MTAMTARPAHLVHHLDSTTRANAQAAANVWADAYEHDPLLSWLLPADQTRRPKLLRWYRLTFLVSPDCVLHMTDDGSAASRWDWVDDARAYTRTMGALRQAQMAIFGSLGVWRRNIMTDLLSDQRPRVPHLYLAGIGVHPSAQRGGRADALMAAGLSMVDQQHRVAYLETQNPIAASIYRRWGFYDAGSVRLPQDGPTMLCMIRDPMIGRVRNDARRG